jgi:hypothetical protein
MNPLGHQKIKVFALPAALLVGIGAEALFGLKNNPYLEFVRHIPPPHSYPLDTVLWIALLMTIQVALLFAILRPASYRMSWGRAVIAFAVSLAFLFFGGIGAMHAPPPWSAYMLWLLAIVMAMLGVTLRSAIGAIISSSSNSKQ